MVFRQGYGEICTWCGIDGTDGRRALSQLVRITAVHGSQVILERPLFFGFSAKNFPSAQKIDMLNGAGIEDCALETLIGGSTDGYRYNVTATAVAGFWMKNVKSFRCVRAHLFLSYGVACEIRDSFFYDAHIHASNGSYGIWLFGPNSDNLIVNNKVLKCPPSFIMSGGGSGNVIAYNYFRQAFYDHTDWFSPTISTHGAHPFMNLFEGNIADGVALDNTWGSSSHNTFLRNHFTMRRTDPPADYGIRAVDVEEHNYYESFIGNVLGEPGLQGTRQAGDCNDNYVLWRLGCPDYGAPGLPPDPYPALTVFRHGNYNYLTGETEWDNTVVERRLPASLYLSAPPDFFAGYTWPPIGPDVRGKVSPLPAASIGD